MLPKTKFLCAVGLIILSFLLFTLTSCGSNTVYVCLDGSQQSTPCSTPNPTTNPTSPPAGSTVVGNTPSDGNEPTNGSNGQEFTGNNTVQGPAIIEWWTGATNAQNQAISCGTFRLDAGQTFTWTHAGHYWTYASNTSVTVIWDGHVAAYKAKQENVNCVVGKPSSS